MMANGYRIRRGLLPLIGIMLIIYVTCTLMNSLMRSNFRSMNTFNIEIVRGFEQEDDSSDMSLEDTFLVNTPNCKIQNFDPFDETVREFIKPYGRILCDGNSSVLYQEGLYLTINWTAVQRTSQTQGLKYCTLIPIYRPKNQPTNHDYFTYLEETSAFNETIKVEHEFVRVHCYDENNTVVHVDFRAFVIPSGNRSNEKALGMSNVLLIGIDSVSRLSYLRHMNKTRHIIENELHAHQMMGYNKIDDNTLLNIVPISLGKLFSELSWNENQTFDEYNFIWKEFSQKGYRTLLAEDWPEVATFDFLKEGFAVPPVDHFYRPFSIAIEKEWGRWSDFYCVLDRFESEIILNYTRDFFNTYNTRPVFAFTFLTKVTHDDDNGASLLDDIFYQFFSRLSDSKNYQNTFIFFFSDHGQRYSNLRNTYIGKLEERLPFMNVIVPDWFRTQYPEVIKKLKNNQRRLSSPFDVYETLQDILHYDGHIQQHNTNLRGISWFNEIPVSRTCANSGILPHWCTCVQHENLDSDSEISKVTSEFVISHINNLTENRRHVCEMLSVFKIHRTERLYQSDQVVYGFTGNEEIVEDELMERRKQSFDDIQITIETIPGNAMFEASARIDLSGNNLHTILGSVSRTNRYGSQSSCVNDFKLKLFCFCKYS